jgi:nucleoid-associated protein YgaU
MSVKMKYQAVLNMGEKFDVKDGYVNEEGEKLKIGGWVKTQLEKDLMWDKIKQIGGEQPQDIEADIKVRVEDYYGIYTVVGGDTLGKISKMFLGTPSRYMDIFNINRDQLNNPDLIKVGQEIKIPFK